MMRKPRLISLVFVLIICALFAAMPMALYASGGESGHGEEGGHGGAKGWVATDTYRVMNFSVLFIGLFLLLRKPMANALAARIEGIKDQLGSLEKEKAGIEKKMAEYAQKISLLDQETKKIMEEYVRQGHETKERIISEAKNAADKLEEQSKKNIAQEFNKTKDLIQAEIIEKALLKAESIIKDRVTDEDHVRLVDEYLEKVVA